MQNKIATLASDTDNISYHSKALCAVITVKHKDCSASLKVTQDQDVKQGESSTTIYNVTIWQNL